MKALICIILIALSAHAQTLSMVPSAWDLIGTVNILSTPPPTFNFPPDSRHGTPYVGRLSQTIPLNLTGKHWLSMTFQIDTTGSPVFNYKLESSNTCVFPAHVRPWLARKDWAKRDRNGTYRWWSQVAAPLQGGLVTITVNLTDLSKWSGVNGQLASTNPTAFTSALANISDIGMTFGGGCFFGHGVNILLGTGTARFTLLSYSIW